MCVGMMASALRTVVNLHMLSLHYYYHYGRRGDSMLQYDGQNIAESTRATSAIRMLKHLIHEITKRICDSWCGECEVIRDDVSLNLFHLHRLTCSSGDNTNSLARSTLRNLKCEEISFTFTFINRKCTFLLVANDSTGHTQRLIISY